MKYRWMEIALTGLALVLLPAGCAFGQKNALSEKEEIKKSFRLSDSNHRQLVIDNMDGEINVVGYDGETIELVAHREIKAESNDKIGVAKQEVTLEIKEEKDKVIVYVDAPWRSRDGANYRGWHYYGYNVTYDFDLKVPRKTSLYLKTINRGKVIVENVEGDFEINNVNGGIEMTNINGPALVRTVNGPIKVSFTKNPGSGCSFKTVNGKIEVVLQDGLNADLRFKTFNGKVYTDYDVVALAQENAAKEEERRTRYVYRRNSSYSVRVGKGGPEFSFDTLNGSIYVLKHD